MFTSFTTYFKFTAGDRLKKRFPTETGSKNASVSACISLRTVLNTILVKSQNRSDRYSIFRVCHETSKCKAFFNDRNLQDFFMKRRESIRSYSIFQSVPNKPSRNENEKASVFSLTNVLRNSTDLFTDRRPVHQREVSFLSSFRYHRMFPASRLRHHRVSKFDDHPATSTILWYIDIGVRIPFPVLHKLSYAARVVVPKRVDRLVIVTEYHK